jgi:hypothetical protein
MSMIKRANGEIKTFTDEDGQVVEAQSNLVWADEKDGEEPIKDELRVPIVVDLMLDINATDDSDDVIARDC